MSVLWDFFGAVDGMNKKMERRVKMISHKFFVVAVATPVIVVFVSLVTLYSAEEKSSVPVIPAKFIGRWIETGNDGKVVGEFKIAPKRIEWIRGKKSELVENYSIESNGESISFDSPVVVSIALNSGEVGIGDRKAKMKVENDTLSVEIKGVPKKMPGMTLTPLPENHRYKKTSAP